MSATRLLRQPKPEVADDQLPAPVVRPLWIGSLLVDPPILQAPMAGYTNYAFRQIVREFGGAGLLATEMVLRQRFRVAGRERGGAPRPVVGRGR